MLPLRKIFIQDTEFCIYESLLIIQFLCNQSAPFLSLQFFHPRKRFLVPISIFANHDSQILAFPQFSSMETDYFIGIHAIKRHNQPLIKVFSQISHPRKEIFFNYERLLIINVRAIIIIVGNSFLAKAHKSFIHKMDFSFPKFLFIINIRGINVHLYGSHLFLFLSLVYRKCFIHQTDLSSMSACLSITLSCGKMFYPRKPN